MNVSCPECRSVFRVDPTKIPTAGVRARCSVCGGVITIGKGGAIENDFNDGRAATTPAARPAPRPQPPQPSRMPTPAPPTPGVAPFARNTPLTGSRPVTPPIATPAAPRPSAPVVPPAPRPSAPNVPGAGRVPAQPPSPPRPQPAAPTPVAPSAPTPRVPVPAQAARSPAAPSAPQAASAPSRSINPFLSNDPNVKAKRLARALVSDIVAYFPQKREEGLRNGTLKQLFREEIKKSYEEYVDQMGKEFAETTTHFQDALNEVLAGGKKLF